MTGGLIIGALVGVIVLVLIRVTGLELPTNLTPHTASDWAWASSP
jgi:hypothetical protein